MGSGPLILVTGASGYVGGCLIPALLMQGWRVRIFVRDRARVAYKSWSKNVEVVEGDLLDPADVQAALTGVSTAYYLVHNMSNGPAYEAKEVESSRNFAAAAAACGLEHIIYLGGLADPHHKIGSHLRFRIRTGEALRQGTVPVTEFRASLVIGSGSISFEMIRYVMEQLPVALGREWMQNRVQPISIQNVLDYLIAALENPLCRGAVYEIGGEDVLNYRETMLAYARLRGLKRSVLMVPWMPLIVMARLAGQLTTVPAQISRPLIDGMQSDSIVNDDSARRDFPYISLNKYEASIRSALEQLRPEGLEFPWPSGQTSIRLRQQGFFIEAEKLPVAASSEAVFRVLTSMGGQSGWFTLNGLWKLRGWVDRRLGGPGLRGRPAGAELKLADLLDFYTVDALESNRRLRLRADLKAPGLGWMEWRVEASSATTSVLTQFAYFAPKGVSGTLYWYLLLPFHRLVFHGLIRAIAYRSVN